MADAHPPLLIPLETPDGVRFVRPPGAPAVRGLGSALFTQFLKVAIALLAAGGIAGYVLLTRWHDLPEWGRAVAPLFPVQLLLDLLLIGRSKWRMARYLLGSIEIELAGDRLRAGRRWGAFWFDQSPPVTVSGLRRLVIARRYGTGEDTGISWDLEAEPMKGPPSQLLSVYEEPETVYEVARPLHARLRDTPGGQHLPPLTEVDRPPYPEPVVRPMLPGGGWTWLAIHLVGTAGLLPILGVLWAARASVLALAASAGLVFVQFLILTVSICYLAMRRQLYPAKAVTHPDAERLDSAG